MHAILSQIQARPQGDIACIIQAANEMPEEYTLEQALEAGYQEIVG